MEKLTEFISGHMNEDTSRLLLTRSKWPEIDMDLAVNSIESRRKLKGKVPEWYEEQQLVFPNRLSAEQCSSSATASYKAALAERIIRSDHTGSGWKIADLTGGLGIDSWFFSRKASKVLYNEMQTALCDAARHNFGILGSGNIEISNNAVGNGPDESSPTRILHEFRPDIVYIDPARRGEGGKKVFLIEECVPDVMTLKEEILSMSRHLLIKLSPMADITMICSRLGPSCREVHVVAAGGECKELLIWMDREWQGEYSVHAVELPNDYPSSEPAEFSFLPSDERNIPYDPATAMLHCEGDSYLFEPGKALMKAGPFKLISQRDDMAKLGRSTHYYTFSGKGRINELKGLGKIYGIITVMPLDKRSMKAVGMKFPKAEVTARNIPMDTDTLRKRLGVTSGDDVHIFGLKSDREGNLLICTRRIQNLE